MRRTAGHIRLPRRILQSAAYRNMPATWRSVLTELLLGAAWGRYTIHRARRSYSLSAGQLWSSLCQLGKAAGVGIRSVRNAVSVFTRLGWLRTSAMDGGILRRGARTLWTLVHYDAWRRGSQDGGQGRGHASAVAPISTRKQENAAQPAGVPVDATYPVVDMGAIRESAPDFLREVLA